MSGRKVATVEIPLTQGKVALIDEEDLPLVSEYKWYACRGGRTWYALAHVRRNGTYTTCKMHRLITAAPDGVQIDHVNRSGLDNRRGNLRPASYTQQQGNIPIAVNNTSGYRGVYWRKDTCKWGAQITIAGKRRNVGSFLSREDAARAYDRAAREHFGEFANLNCPDEVAA